MPIGNKSSISGKGHDILNVFNNFKIPLFIVGKYLKKSSGNRISTILINIKVFLLDSIVVLSINLVKAYVDIVTMAKRSA